MSRQYKPSEWLEFLTGNEQSKNVKQLQVYFHQRVYELAENYCYENHVDKGMAGDMRIDPEEASYLAYASLAGEGVGLWEGRRPWHAGFEVVIKSDVNLGGIFNNMQEHVRS